MEAVKDRILDAARVLFLKHGYEAVSLRKIAEAIDYTAPAIYTHFKDKTDLLREMCRRDFGRWAEAFRKLGTIADPIERILRSGRLYVKLGIEHPGHYQIMFMSPCPVGLKPTAEDLAILNDPDQDAYAFLRHAVREAIAQNLLRPDLKDADLVAQALWAGVHGVTACQITHGDDEFIKLRNVHKRAELVTEAMLRGMLRDPFRPLVSERKGESK